MSEIRRDPSFVGTRFIVEPGRFLVGEAGVYIGRVNDIKISRGKKFLILDGGMNHHLAASGNLGQVIKRNFPLAVVTKLSCPSRDVVEVVGPLCTPLDTLGRDVRISEAAVGDLVGILQSGAYACSASPVGFLSHPLPCEVLIQNGKARLVECRGNAEDSLTNAN
jgi:diaminopimelate decarboxylase